MKKSRLLAAALCSFSLIAGSVLPVSADGMKVVTLGADLSEAQCQTMLKYFNVNANEVQIMYITNQDEREHLSGYVPLEQIGTRTVSCAYVKPTSSGGIKVRTANLNWVTGNMIATTLSTSGVKNCEVVAACPFEVSGTGALTGIQMAYEKATGETLDANKKEIATQEIVVTGNLADQVGRTDATAVINKAKMEVIENNIQNSEEIYNIVYNIAQQTNVNVTAEQIDSIVVLLQEIAEQDYSYDDVKDTLEHVDENVSGESGEYAVEIAESEGDPDAESVEVADEDSIINAVDESVLGENIVESSTEDQSLEEATYEDGAQKTGSAEEDDLVEVTEEDWDFVDDGSEMEGTEEVVLVDEDPEFTEETGAEVTVEEEPVTEETASESGEGSPEEETSEEDQMIAALSEQAKSQYDKVRTFCRGEYLNMPSELSTVMGPDFVPSAILTDTEVAEKLVDKVSGAYLQILANGTGSYVPTGFETYMSVELNMMQAELKKIFGIDGSVPEGEDILVNVAQADRQLLYEDTMKYFEKLYGEETFDIDDSEEVSEEVSEDMPEETYEESASETSEETYEESPEEYYEEPMEENYDETYSEEYTE